MSLRIGVLSDSHDRLPAIEAALDTFAQRKIDAIVHAGDLIAPFAAKRLAAADVPVYVVYGNNDGERAGLRSVLPQIQSGPLWLELDEKRILVHHFIDWCDAEAIDQADLVITGHTHEPVHETRGKTVLLNPGEVCGWVTGRSTVAVVELDSLSVEMIEVFL